MADRLKGQRSQFLGNVWSSFDAIRTVKAHHAVDRFLNDGRESMTKTRSALVTNVERRDTIAWTCVEFVVIKLDESFANRFIISHHGEFRFVDEEFF